ncbi:MAG TPA: CHAP domain-containing protein [Candidatus Saccharimonas sp.]|nr:CHAP domain-containing protein [Candidatus Saccharimonas sp.]
MSLPNPHPYLSAYLDATPAAVKSASRGSRTRNRVRILSRLVPALKPLTWAGLACWVVILSIGAYGYTHRQVPSLALLNAPTKPAATARLVSSTKAEFLPGGPSSQLLPPGTMAPQGTYINGYARGQCTWYVAGRRPIPSNWGNARTWFGHAVAMGWNTGTVPAVAAIAWTPQGYFGHVALVEDVDPTTGQVLISEMNYLGLGRLDKRWVKATDFKYIY